MRNSRTFLFIAAGLVMAAPAGAQQIDSAQAKYPQPMVIQYTRPQDKRGLNMFETPKVAGATYEGFKMTIGAAFTQQFQGLSHSNDADSVAVAAVNPSPGNAGTPASANRNRLIQIGHGFNNATANMILNAQLAPGIRVQMTSYLSSRHHNETWVKDGFIQIDESPFDVPLFNNLMKYTTVKIGHFEVNYGDALIPLDKWFGTWHDGSPEGEARMQERYRRRKERIAAAEAKKAGRSGEAASS